MSKNTDTPITGNQTDRICLREIRVNENRMLERNSNLERQLAEANRLSEIRMMNCWAIEEQRDRLAEALRAISRQRSNRYESTVGVVCNIADEALAALNQQLS